MTLYKKHQRFWGNTAEEMYEKWKGQDPWFRDVVDRLLKLKPTSLLDAGCGQGISYDRFPESLRNTYVGVDQIPQMIDCFKQRHPDAQVAYMDISKMDFADNKFDCVICFNVLIYFDDRWLETIKELFRVTENTLIFSVRLWDKPDEIIDGEIIKNYKGTLDKLAANFKDIKIGDAVSEKMDYIIEIRK